MQVKFTQHTFVPLAVELLTICTNSKILNYTCKSANKVKPGHF